MWNGAGHTCRTWESMDRYNLNRQEKGKVAELLAKGLHKDPQEQVPETITSHADTEYSNLIGDWSIVCGPTDINPYQWTDEVRAPIPEDLSWRPDIIMQATWRRRFELNEIPDPEYWRGDLPPFSLKTSLVSRINPTRRERYLDCYFRVYYPIEVKSGEKRTLTSQQATAISRVSEEVDYVHPLIAELEIAGLPEQYGIDVQLFASSDWADSDSRYP